MLFFPDVDDDDDDVVFGAVAAASEILEHIAAPYRLFVQMVFSSSALGEETSTWNKAQRKIKLDFVE